MKYLTVDPREACHFLTVLLGWKGGSIPLYLDGERVSSLSCDSPREAAATLWRRAREFDLRRSAQVEVGLPRVENRIDHSTVLWAWVKGHDQLRRAARFKPPPALVLRFGASTERLLMWGLREPLSWPEIIPHNERISYALRAPRTRCDAGALLVPLPMTFLRVGRSRPVPVLLTRMELTGYTRSQVTARLKDPPPRDAWRERAA